MEVTEALLTRTGVFFCFLLFFLTQVCFNFSTTPLFCSPFHGCACRTSRERRRVAFSNFLPTLLASFPLFFGHLIGPGVLSVPLFYISPPLGLGCSWHHLKVCIYVWRSFFFFFKYTLALAVVVFVFNQKPRKIQMFLHPCTCGQGLKLANVVKSWKSCLLDGTSATLTKKPRCEGHAIWRCDATRP